MGLCAKVLALCISGFRVSGLRFWSLDVLFKGRASSTL